jgi:hypothetical protein
MGLVAQLVAGRQDERFTHRDLTGMQDQISCRGQGRVKEWLFLQQVLRLVKCWGTWAVETGLLRNQR